MFLKVNDHNIQWTNEESHYFFNPSHPEAKKLALLSSKLPFLPGHIYLFTSSNLEKICLISKEACLSSAKSVNKNLVVQKEDKWLISLPLFHIAGIAILARSFQANNSFEILSSWNPKKFKKLLEEKTITLSSLVPAQVYDLVRLEIKAPSSLRAILVGGGSLSPLLYQKARDLNWPLLPSYGLTELASQVACATLDSLSTTAFPKKNLLDPIKIKKSNTGFKIKTKSLLTCCFDLKNSNLYDPKDLEGWFELPDEIVLKNNHIEIKGRKDEQIKILGESLNLKKLSDFLEELCGNFFEEYHIVATPDIRNGFKLNLVTNSFEISKSLFLIKKFNARVLPFEKIEAIYCLPEIKKSTLFKIRQDLLKQQIGMEMLPKEN